MISPRHLLSQKAINRLRKLANILDPGYRLRQMPRTARGIWFRRNHPVLEQAAANNAIAEILIQGQPAALGKIGNTELRVVMQWLAQGKRETARFLPGLREEAFVGAGIFPATDGGMVDFCRLWLDALGSLDLLAVWHNAGEALLAERCCPQALYVREEDYYPYLHDDPWSRTLAGRRVLVVTPFAHTVQQQFARRALIWEKQPAVLPDCTLDVLAVPFSPALVSATEPTWTARLQRLAAAMEKRTFDIAIIGAGALSLPLVAKAKAMGRIGIHLGGATQMLFGIRGRRFDADPDTVALMNAHWTRPLPQETPAAVGLVENAAYW
jgi:hypothetical protein